MSSGSESSGFWCSERVLSREISVDGGLTLSYSPEERYWGSNEIGFWLRGAMPSFEAAIDI